MNEMVLGQMYRVAFTGFSKDNQEVTKTEYLMIGSSIEDIKLKFSYVVDVSDFSRYKFDYVVKEPDRVHILWTKIERTNPAQEDATIQRESGTVGIWQKVEKNGKKYTVRASTTCFAKSEKHALKKLSTRILGGSETVILSAEEIFSGDGYAKPKDSSMFTSASFVRG